MESLKIKDIITAVDGTLLCGDPETEIKDVCTDTRRIGPDSLFVPLVGERFDAHSFIPAAIEGGCSASLSANEIASDKPIVLVRDTKEALGKLAAFYRRRFDLPVVAVTGSVGKTTVKELTAAALSVRLNVLKTAGNFNNEIGLPLTLFRLAKEHQVAITEMGMSGFGEIDALARMAAPDIGLMTNIGLSHIEKLGTQENIYKAKAELFNHIHPEGTVIINGDDPILSAHRADIGRKVISVGLDDKNDLYAKDICSTEERVSFTVVHGNEQHSATLSFPGEHNVTNALLACGAAMCLNIPLKEALRGIETYVPGDKRMQILNKGGITIINDCYNAAPASVEAALKVLSAYTGRKIAVIGDIRELGDFSESAHRAIGEQAVTFGVSALFTFGEHTRHTAEAAKKDIASYHFNDITALNNSLSDFLKDGDVVLIKGSRAMQLERVTDFLVNGRTK